MAKLHTWGNSDVNFVSAMVATAMLEGQCVAIDYRKIA